MLTPRDRIQSITNGTCTYRTRFLIARPRCTTWFLMRASGTLILIQTGTGELRNTAGACILRCCSKLIMLYWSSRRKDGLWSSTSSACRGVLWSSCAVRVTAAISEPASGLSSAYLPQDALSRPWGVSSGSGARSCSERYSPEAFIACKSSKALQRSATGRTTRASRRRTTVSLPRVRTEVTILMRLTELWAQWVVNRALTASLDKTWRHCPSLSW
mmetsp:Transcript_7433/g.17682  ORF Transcript_7433/g.17682 Transcript_7433/m.17682 type:complete len:216 (+) Transcript_7433:661-1308(+)